MRSTYVQAYGKGSLEDLNNPSRFLIGSKNEKLVENEPKAERLTEVAGKDAAEEELIVSEIINNQVRVRKGAASKVPAPTDGEGLRHRYKLLANAWVLARFRYSNRAWLKNVTPSTYTKLADFILGEKVLNIERSASVGNDVEVGPSWEICLNYEFAIWKKAYEYVRDDGQELVTALDSAMKNEELRGFYFTAPFIKHIATYHQRQAGQRLDSKGEGNFGAAMASNYQQRNNPYKGGCKGGKHGKGSGKNGKHLHAKTSGGKAICFGYNNGECDDSAQCGMQHVCQRVAVKGTARETQPATRARAKARPKSDQRSGLCTMQPRTKARDRYQTTQNLVFKGKGVLSRCLWNGASDFECCLGH